MPYDGAGAIDDLEVVGEGYGSVVEQDVVVGAQTKDVGEVVDAVVTGAEWHQVCTFRVGSGRCLQTNAADLAGEVVEAFHGLWNVAVTGQAVVGDQPSLGRRGLACSAEGVGHGHGAGFGHSVAAELVATQIWQVKS